MDWRYLFLSLEGRISRSQYWLYGVLVLGVLNVAAALLIGSTTDPESPVSSILSIIMVLVFFWPSLALQVKRWHDRGKSGWWVCIGFVPLIGSIWAFVECCILAGDEGRNRFGHDPREGQEVSPAIS